MAALIFLAFAGWLFFTLIGLFVSILFNCALTVLLVLKVFLVIGILAFLYDMWSSYKGNGGFF